MGEVWVCARTRVYDLSMPVSLSGSLTWLGDDVERKGGEVVNQVAHGDVVGVDDDAVSLRRADDVGDREESEAQRVAP